MKMLDDGWTVSSVDGSNTAHFEVTVAVTEKGYDLLRETGADSVIPVVRFGYPIQRALMIESGRLLMIWPENLNKRSQDIMPSFHDVGQFYWLNVKSFF